MPKPNSTSTQELAHTIGHDLLGPVVHRWLLGLDQHFAYFDAPDARFLFCARAGVRIKELYEHYLEGSGRTLPDNAQMFWVSRLALCKGLYGKVPERATKIIASEYPYQTIRNVVEGLFRHNVERLEAFDLDASECSAPASEFPAWLDSNSVLARFVAGYLADSSQAFEAYVANLVGRASNVVLIDSGWQGTGQSLLHHAYPEIDWHGLYVGRILTPDHDRAIVDRAIGLLFQSETYLPEKPETAIVLHRHLFETMLEPNGPSIEEIAGGPSDDIAKQQIAANETAEVSSERDPLYILVREYLKNNAGLGPAEIMARHQAAMPKLARILAQPTRDEALALYAKDRSADFGKELDVPVLIVEADEQVEEVENTAKPKYETRDDRIQHSLWPQGQIALEFDGKLRDELQLRVAGLSDNISYFDFASDKNAGGLGSVKPELPQRPIVAVITRTKNRPILLKRAAQSVANQTYKDYLWVIVNDGGDEDVVREVIAQCAVDRCKIRLVSNAKSLGMEAASNAGIRHVESDYVLIHDDDDALHPDFLKETVDFLESSAGARYGGVVTRSEYVSEEIRGDEVIIHSRVPYMDWVRNIQLAELMAQNLFAPISFVYRRSLYDEIDGYNPELPVLGDWYFNLEFLLRADIKVLPLQLAYYHHRDRGDSSKSGVYSNSVIGGQSKHEEFASVCRNMFVRKYAKDNSMASMVLMAYFTQDLRNRIAQQGGQSAPAPSPSVEAAWASYSESDRLWVLSQVLEERANRAGWFRKSMPPVSKNAPMIELADFAQRNKITLEAPSSFDDAEYLEQNPDVAGAVRAGDFASGFEHYALNGHLENRGRPSKT